MAETFKELKRKRKAGFKQLRESVRFNVKTHRKTKLIQAGVGDTRTLLNVQVSADHASRLGVDIVSYCVSNRRQNDDLRFLTLLHEVCELDVERVIESAQRMRELLTMACEEVKVFALGVVEIELVNLTLLKRIQEQTDVEKRKLHVLCDLITPTELDGLVVRNAEGTKALVHSHLLVDVRGKADEFEAQLKKMTPWRKTGYQVRLEPLHSNKSLWNNLDGIAKYGTKSGNETLRYKAGFGRDLSEDLDAKMFKGSKTGKRDRGGETLEDERSLTVGEVAFLNEAYERLMTLRRDRRGYLIRAGK